jgi:WD40 repeat protein
MRYNAFLSYSHADEQFATRLHSSLERFAKPWNRLRALTIFRDRSDLSANPGAWSALTDALHESEFLILLASPSSSESPWVTKELNEWMSLREPKHILLALVGGELAWDPEAGDFDWQRTTALSFQCRGYFREEPLWCDLRAFTGSKPASATGPPFEDAVATLAAALHQGPKREMVGEDLRQHRRTLRLARGTIVLLSVMLIGLSIALGIAYVQRHKAETANKVAQEQRVLAEDRRVVAERQTEIAKQKSIEAQQQTKIAKEQKAEAEREAKIALSRQLAATARYFLSERHADLDTAALLAIESARRTPLFENDQALRGALELMARPLFSDRTLGEIRTLSFSPDGRRLVAGAINGPNLFDVDRRGAPSVSYVSNASRGAVFSPNGQWIGTVSGVNTVELHDPATGYSIWKVDGGERFNAVAFSPDSRWMGAVGDDWQLRLIDTSTGSVIYTKPHKYNVIAVAFSPKGNLVATGAEDNFARVFETQTGQEVASFHHENNVTHVAFSHDGQRLATASYDSTARVFDLAGKKQISQLLHRAVVRWVEFSPDDKWIATASDDGTTRVFEADSCNEVSRLSHQSMAKSAQFSPDRRFVLTASLDGTARVFHAGSGMEQVRIPNPGWVNAAAFSPDGRQVVTATNGGFIGLFDPWERENAVIRARVRKIERSTWFERLPVGFDLGGRWVAIADLEPRIRVIDCDGRARVEFAAPPDITTLRVSRDGRLVAVGSAKGDIQLITATGETLWKKRLTDSPEVNGVAFSGDGKWIAAGANDHFARVLDAASGNLRAQFYTGGGVYGVALSQDGRWLAAGGLDKYVRVFNAFGDQEVSKFQAGAEVTSVAFSPDAREVLAAGKAPAAWLVSASNGGLIREFKHDHEVTSVAFSDDGKLIGTGSYDSTLRVFDRDGQELSRMAGAGTIVAIRFAGHDRRLRAASIDRAAPLDHWHAPELHDPKFTTVQVRTFLLDTEELIRLTCERLTRNLIPLEWSRYLAGQTPGKTCPNLP